MTSRFEPFPKKLRPRPRDLCVLGFRQARGRMLTIGDAPLVQQPSMDNLPLIASAWSEIQKRRLPILKLAKEL
jgi:hypothetical protein